jgi:nucleotide-binding universal stress UspA family protein
MLLAAVDQSAHAHAVMRKAAELASLIRSNLTILTVLDPDPMRMGSINEPSRIASFQREIVFHYFPKRELNLESSDSNGSVYRYRPVGIEIHTRILPGNPVERICAVADELKADLVIVGNRGLGGMAGIVLGSVSERVVHKCTRSVLVVKGEASEGGKWQEEIHSSKDSPGIRSLK